MKQLGMDIGTSSVKLVLMEDGVICGKWMGKHHGRLLATILAGLESLAPPDEDWLCAVTGANARIVTERTDVFRLGDVPALTEGLKKICPEAGSVIDIGGQGARFVSGLTAGMPEFNINEHCAGGTGSFFEDQMSRLNMKIEDYSALVRQARSVPRLSGRCAVFAKSDIIHHQQEGVPAPDILLGLCYAMVRNYKAAIVKNLPVVKPVAFVGGVTLNEGVVRAVREVFALADGELLIPEEALYVSAIGAAVKAETVVSLEGLTADLTKAGGRAAERLLPKLLLTPGTVLAEPEMTGLIPADGCALGIDIGSTSTNLVLIGRDGRLIDAQYLRTAGNPEAAVRRGLNTIRQKYGEIPFLSVGVTGSGRERIGRMIGADAIRDEITAQAKGAVFAVPAADTVFEIGGQDSKYISLKNGEVADFQMNKICAAGTGSFVEEQAARMNIPIGEFGDLALTAETPAELGERCTVFIETAIESKQAEGAEPKDIAAGLCHAIVRNYLHKVVGNRPVGRHIVLQGGVAYNPGIVAAFQQEYRERLTVSPCFSVSGAFGVALLALEAAGTEPSGFKGYDFPGAEAASEDYSAEVKKNIEFYRRAKQYFFKGYEPVAVPGRKTVGIPYVLMMHKFFPLANAFFKALGFNVLLSDPSNRETIRLSQESARGETCYPVKLIYGHMLELAAKKVDYIFLPHVRTIKHEKSGAVSNYGCVYMQSAAASIARVLRLEEKGIKLLNPTFDLDFGKEAMAAAMLAVGQELGRPKPLCVPALMAGAMAVRQYTAAAEKLGRELLDTLRPEDKVLVMITRNYGLQDPVLNMGIPELLLERGYKVINLEHLPAHDLSLEEDYPNLYWPFGQHILSGAKLIARHPNLYAVYLTNHGCGPDTMLAHMFKEEMGEKPYLQIEVDEHFSKVGVITRIEAFLNSLSRRPALPLPDNFELTAVKPRHRRLFVRPEELRRERDLYLPELGAYTEYIRDYFRRAYGLETKVMPGAGRLQLMLGRAETSAKEYLPFTALLGSVLHQLQKIKPEERARADFLIPMTEGAEADGQYAGGIRSVLNGKGYEQVGIFAPILEQAPITLKEPELLFRALLAGDLFYAAPPEKRENTKRQRIPDAAELVRLAAESRPEQAAGAVIAVVGTPLCQTVLNEGVLDTLEAEGIRIVRAPLAEALLFQWREEAHVQKNGAETLRRMRALLAEVFACLGQASAVTADMDHLTQTADRYVKGVQGGNLRYRYAKAVELGERFSAVLALAPRYENAAMVMEMRNLSAEVKARFMQIYFDGDWDETAWARLRSFLYYLKAGKNQ